MVTPPSVSADSTRQPLWRFYVKSALLHNVTLAYNGMQKSSLKQLVLKSESLFYWHNNTESTNFEDKTFLKNNMVPKTFVV